jgi:hypothetical protein
MPSLSEMASSRFTNSSEDSVIDYDAQQVII